MHNRWQQWIVFLIVYGLFLAVGVVAILSIVKAIDVSPTFEKWAVGVLVADVFAAGMTVFRQMFSSQTAPLRVDLMFTGGQGLKIKLDEEKCLYEVRDAENQVKGTGRCKMTPVGESWQAEFVCGALPSETIRLRLFETNGTVWEVPNFHPNERSEQAIKKDV